MSICLAMDRTVKMPKCSGKSSSVFVYRWIYNMSQINIYINSPVSKLIKLHMCSDQNDVQLWPFWAISLKK